MRCEQKKTKENEKRKRKGVLIQQKNKGVEKKND